MLVLKKYQEEAIDNLLQNTYKLLRKSGVRHPQIFKAPTGSGKTIMMAAFLDKICQELPEKYELDKRKIAFVWIAPNKLYIQSYDSIKNYFSETRSVKPIYFDDLTGDRILPNEVLFVNWESINKVRNLMVRENEQGKTLYNYINRAKLDNTEIVVIIDEEHMFASPRTAKRANEVLHNIYPKIEIRVSATPVTRSDYIINVERGDVVKEEMIKEGILLNPKLDEYQDAEGKTTDEILIDVALQKRQQIRAAYEKFGININPLLLIQLPNDVKDTNTSLDLSYIETVLNCLKTTYDITVSNHKLAIWLSGQYENVVGIEEKDNITEVLLFKQAVALGWDCPRAAVLLIFRELQSTTFTIQTVGRILRMPEHKHYPDALLNFGYVFTNLSKDKIEIVRDDMSYISMNRALRKSDYLPVELHSTYINQRIVRNRLGSKFRLALYEAAEKMWSVVKPVGMIGIDENRKRLQERMINIDVSTIDIVLPENIALTGELEIKIVTDTVKFAKTPDELNRLFRLFCRANIGPYAPVDSVPVLEMSLKYFFEDYLRYIEFDAVKIILYPDNQPQFIELIAKAMEIFEKMQEAKAKGTTKEVFSYPWEVPVERTYNDLYLEMAMPTHALEPFFEQVRASNPEKTFASYLESKKDFLAWWYKNGDSGKEHFAVKYIDYLGKESLFYVDFVIHTKLGVTCLFDTKTAGSDPGNAARKHNALIEYIEARTKAGKPTIGGVIVGRVIGENKMWQYCRNKIENTTDFRGWDFFDPALTNKALD